MAEDDRDTEPKKDNDLAARVNRGRPEAAGEALLRNATKPHEVFFALRTEVLPSMESGHKPDIMDQSYTPPAQLKTIDGRARDLGHSITELKEMGILLEYDPITGIGKLANEDCSGYAISTTYEPIVNQKTGLLEHVPFFYIGTDTERLEMSEAYKTAGLELEARAIEGWWVGLFLNLGIRDDLEGLVNIMHKATAKFKPEHLKALFNLPDFKKLVRNPDGILKKVEGQPNPEKNVGFGDQIEEGMFLTALMLHSGSKEEMESFLRRPGSTVLINQLAEKSNMDVSDWVAKYIGDVSKWVDNPKVTDYMKDQIDVDGDGKVNLLSNRGLLTKYGNIAAYKGVNDKGFSINKQREFIEKTIGGAIGSVEAAWVAVTFLKSIDTFSVRGHSFLQNGDVVATLGEGRYIEPADTQKLFSLVWLLREGLKGRTSGLNDMLGKTPDMNFDLFDWAQVEVDLGDGTIVSRSIWDAWLGTELQYKRDIRTMEPSKINNITDIENREEIERNNNIGFIKMTVEVDDVDKETGKKNGKKHKEDRIVYGQLSKEDKKDVVFELVKEEGYHRLGDLNFDSLPPDFHGVYNTIKWLAGREGGVMLETTSADVDPKKFRFYDVRKFWKYISIVLNPVVLAKGSMHKFSFGGNGKIEDVILDFSEEGLGSVIIPNVDGKAHVEIQKTFLNNLILARLKSESFILDSFEKTLSIPNIGGEKGGRKSDVPLFAYVMEVVKLMNGKFPTNLKELINWRVDLNKLFSNRSTTYDEVVKYLESLVKDELGNDRPVGPVTGVNKFDK